MVTTIWTNIRRLCSRKWRNFGLSASRLHFAALLMTNSATRRSLKVLSFSVTSFREPIWCHQVNENVKTNNWLPNKFFLRHAGRFHSPPCASEERAAWVSQKSNAERSGTTVLFRFDETFQYVSPVDDLEKRSALPKVRSVELRLADGLRDYAMHRVLRYDEASDMLRMHKVWNNKLDYYKSN